MTVKKLDTDFYNETNERLSNTSQLRLFSLLQDIETKERFLNIFNAYMINEDVSRSVIYEKYEVGNNEWWDNISNKLYGTPYLWWILPMINNIVNPFESLEEGTEINVLKERYIYQMLKEIRNLGDV